MVTAEDAKGTLSHGEGQKPRARSAEGKLQSAECKLRSEQAERSVYRRGRQGMMWVRRRVESGPPGSALYAVRTGGFSGGYRRILTRRLSTVSRAPAAMSAS